MTMTEHAPVNYVCPFCRINGESESYSNEGIVLENEWLIAVTSLHQWNRNKGHTLVIPKQHHENIYALPDEYATPIHTANKLISAALKKVYSCDGITIRQNNEPASGQDVWHLHVHIIPRYESDNLSQNELRLVSVSERQKQALKLREAIRSS